MCPSSHWLFPSRHSFHRRSRPATHPALERDAFQRCVQRRDHPQLARDMALDDWAHSECEAIRGSREREAKRLFGQRDAPAIMQHAAEAPIGEAVAWPVEKLLNLLVIAPCAAELLR